MGGSIQPRQPRECGIGFGRSKFEPHYAMVEHKKHTMSPAATAMCAFGVRNHAAASLEVHSGERIGEDRDHPNGLGN